MKKNVFTVDLGEIKLTEAQRSEIDRAIHLAVTGVLVNVPGFDDVVLFPLKKFTKGPIIDGRYAVKFNNIMVKERKLDQLDLTDLNIKNRGRG